MSKNKESRKWYNAAGIKPIYVLPNGFTFAGDRRISWAYQHSLKRGKHTQRARKG